MAQPSMTDIEVEANEAAVRAIEGQSKWPGMSYEEGVDAALSWVVGNREESPNEG